MSGKITHSFFIHKTFRQKFYKKKKDYPNKKTLSPRGKADTQDIYQQKMLAGIIPVHIQSVSDPYLLHVYMFGVGTVLVRSVH